MKKFIWLVPALFYCGLLLSGTAHAQLATGTVDFDVDSLRDQSQVTMSLSDNSTLTLLRDYVVDHEPDSYTWVGSIQSDVNGSAFITVNKPNAVGVIQTSTRLFELTITQALTDPVQEIDPLTLPLEAAPLQGPVFSDGFEDGAQPLSVEIPAAACDDTPASIDVMVLYSDDAMNASGDIDAEIRLAIEMANKSFPESHIDTSAPDGIELKLNLVHTQMVQVDENSWTGMKNKLRDFVRTGDEKLDQVHDLRNQYKADLTFLILESTESGGIAYVTDKQELAFAIVRRKNIKDHTFTHEMGHLFGARHDKYTLERIDDIPPPYTGLNYGYSHTGLISGWRTIMAYKSECEATYLSFLWCPRLGFFSSPDYSHDGVPRGVEGTDNRKQLINAAPARACYRARPKLSVQKLNKANGQPTLGGLVQSSGGTITPAIDCGLLCEGTAITGSTVTLTAKNSGNWRFVRWAEGGACAGSTSPQCGFTLTVNQLARPEFTLVDFAAPLSPKASFLRSDPGDPPVNPIVINLNELGILPGQVIELSSFGLYYFGTDQLFEGRWINMVFSSSSELLSHNELNRVPGALPAAGNGLVTTTTCYTPAQLQTDIPEDFHVTDPVIVTVPPGALFLFAGIYDCAYWDNSDPNGDLEIAIKYSPD